MIKTVIKKKEEIFKDVAKIYEEQINNKPKSILGLATGSSPIGLYKELEILYKDNKISFEEIKTFNLDEYCGLDKSDKNSYFTFMNENLFSHVNINIENTFFPPTDISKLEEYKQKLSENEIDIQLLGIGSNGHIAFNEPGSNFDSQVRVVELDQKTIEDNSRFFDSIDDVPKEAITMGLANIMKAKKIILIAIGESKAQILQEIFKDDEITETIPATILKKHPDVTFYIDEDAAKYLK